MYASLVQFTFVILIFSHRCICNDEDDEQNEILKPLKLPKKLDHNYDITSTENLFQSLGLNFFSMLPTIQASPLFYKMWTTIPDTTSNIKYWLGFDPYANACASEKTNDVYKTTKEGDALCYKKCSEQNEAYANFLDGYMQKAVSLAEEDDIIAVIKPINENIHECAPKLLFSGLSCNCKHNLQIMVNERCQENLDAAFSTDNLIVRDFDGDSKNPDHVAWYWKLAGAIVSFEFVPYIFPVYLFWWIFISK